MNHAAPPIVAVLLLCALAAQDPERTGDQLPAPGQPVDQGGVTSAAGAGLAAALSDPGFLVFDEPGTDGALWVRGSNFKASFAERGWTFVPKPGAGAPVLQPIGFRLDAVRVGGRALAVADAAPQRSGRRVVYAHGDVEQTIDVDARGVEQGFVFASLPQRGELVVDLAVATDLAGGSGPEGLVFRGPHDRVTYSRAVAIDAVGERIACATGWQDGRITITVPGDFVARAALPLVIDPRVALGIVTASSSGDLADPDVTGLSISYGFFPITASFWTVVFAHYFGANDWDCYVQGLDLNLVLDGGPIAIDITTNGWQRPRIASINAFGNFMVVAQVRSGSSPIKVAGRIVGYSMGTSGNGTASPGPQFDVARFAVDALRPDICGDPTPAGVILLRGAAFYTVVFEFEKSASDHDIYARQVEPGGFLRPILTIQNDLVHQSYPSISKSLGRWPDIGQRAAIVYQQDAGGANQDIHGALLTWDGILVPVNGSNTFAIDTSGSRDVQPQVSSPTMPDGTGRRRILAVYERAGSNAGDIVATCFDGNGTILARGNVTVLENDPVRTGWPQFAPAVDSDGLRFGVAYHEGYQGGTTDLDTRMSLVALAGNSLMVEEAGAILGFTGNREFNVQVASWCSVNGTQGPRYCTTNDRDNQNGTFVTDAYTYDGVPPPAISYRALACGTLSISAQGQTTLGGTISFSLATAMPLAGYLFGAPVTVPIAPCGGCTIGASGDTVFGSQLSVTIAMEPMFIGLPLSAQGFGFDASGPCLGQIHLTNAVDFVLQ